MNFLRAFNVEATPATKQSEVLMSNPVPWYLQLLGGWISIQQQVDDWAQAHGHRTYTEAPTLYSFYNWWPQGFRLGCNVRHFPHLGEEIEAGRFNAR